MKVITLPEPYASLFLAGAKHYESRDKTTDYRGPIAIHAAASKDGLDQFLEALRWAKLIKGPRGYNAMRGTFTYECAEALKRIHMRPIRRSDFILGAIIAIGELVDVRRGDHLLIEPRERLFGLYEPGRFAWEISQVQPLTTPVVIRGQRGLWDWTPESEVQG